MINEIETNLRRKTNIQGKLKKDRTLDSLHNVWDLIGQNKIKQAAKEYIKEIESKTNIFSYARERDKAKEAKRKSTITYNVDELYSGLFGILRELDTTLARKPLKNKEKALVFRMEVVAEIERRMGKHSLGTKGFSKIVRAAKRAADVELKESKLKDDIVKYSLF